MLMNAKPKIGDKTTMQVKLKNLGNGKLEVISPKLKSVEFCFTLDPEQAQEIYSLLACYLENDEFPKIWDTKSNQCARNSVRRFQRQLDRQYAETGIEI